jgi:thiamine-monophosphate kinase
MGLNEFDLIARIRARAGKGDGVVVGIGDDAAVLQPGSGMQLVATADNLIAGRHFDEAATPAEIGHLGARPRWCLLTLTLPEPDPAWLDGFLDGFLGLAEAQRCSLVGGNMARGPLDIAVTALGEVPAGHYAGRSGARLGDRLLVTGTLGDAGHAWRHGAKPGDPLRQRLLTPEPRLSAGAAMAPGAHAMIDVSDGLLADLGHLLDGKLGAEIDCTRLPASTELRAQVPDDGERWRLQLAGGSDYELLAAWPATVPLPRTGETPLTEIGRIVATPGIRCLGADGKPLVIEAQGWDHFREAEGGPE